MGSGGRTDDQSLYGFIEHTLPAVPSLIEEFAREVQRVADMARDDQVVSRALAERIEAGVRAIRAVADDAKEWRGQARRENEADVDRVENPRKGPTPEGRADSQRGRQDM
jgi:hypothetical protein